MANNWVNFRLQRMTKAEIYAKVLGITFSPHPVYDLDFQLQAVWPIHLQ